MPSAPKTTKGKGGRTECTVTFTAEERQAAEQRALEKLSAAVKVDGFRPGKAPPEMIRERIKDEALLEETLQILVPPVLQQVMAEQKVSLIVPPKVGITARDPLTVMIVLVEKPPVTMKKIAAVPKDTPPSVTDADVERTIAEILRAYAMPKPVDRTANTGDRVTVDFAASDLTGKDVEGMKATAYPLVIGDGGLLPGFEEQIVGMKKGEKKTFMLTLPETHRKEELRKKPVSFAVTVQQVEEMEGPTLTDDFAKEQMGAENAAAMRTRIRQMTEAERGRKAGEDRERKIFDAIRAATKVELAPELMEHEERLLVQDLVDQLAQQQMTIEQWLGQTGQKPEEFGKELQSQAEKRVTLRLGIEQLIADRGITVTDGEMETIVRDALATMPEDERTKQADDYKQGGRGYEQLQWSTTVQRLIASF